MINQINLLNKKRSKEEIYKELIKEKEELSLIVTRDEDNNYLLYCPYCEKFKELEDYSLNDEYSCCGITERTFLLGKRIVRRVFYIARPINEDSFEIAKVIRVIDFNSYDLTCEESYDVIAFTIVDIKDIENIGKIFIKRKGVEGFRSTSNISRLSSFPNKEKGMSCFGSTRLGFDDIANMTKVTERLGIKNLLNKLDLKHIELKSFMEIVVNHDKAEVLEKSGFDSLVEDLYKNPKSSKKIINRGSSLNDIVRLPRNLRRVVNGKDFDFIVRCEQLHEEGEFDVDLLLELFELVDFNRHLRLVSNITSIMANGYSWLTTNKIMNYLIKVNEEQAFNPVDAAITWRDYIIMKEELGVPYDRYPDYLKTKHDLVSREVALLKNEKLDKKIKEKGEFLERFKIEDDEYDIIFPKSGHDLYVEGESLGHCVGSYSNRIAEGKTNVGFIRSKDDLEKPLYTLEFKDGEVIQIQGRNYVNLYQPKNKELKIFIDRFLDNYKKQSLKTG